MQNLSLKSELYNHSKIFVFLNCLQFDPTLFLFPLIYNDGGTPILQKKNIAWNNSLQLKKNQLHFISKHMQKKGKIKATAF